MHKISEKKKLSNAAVLLRDSDDLVIADMLCLKDGDGKLIIHDSLQLDFHGSCYDNFDARWHRRDAIKSLLEVLAVLKNKTQILKVLKDKNSDNLSSLHL